MDILKINFNRKTYVENPLASYKLIKRHVKDLEYFMQKYPYLKQRLIPDTILPNENDLIGAIKGLVRLQKVFNLTASDLSEGIVDGIDTHVTLSTQDIILIGEKLTELGGETYFAEEFLKLALARTVNKKYLDNTRNEIIESIFKFYLNNNEYTKATKVIDDLNVEERQNMVQKNWDSFYRARSIEKPHEESFELNGLHSSEKEQLFLRKVCRGEIRKSPKEESKLTCRFHSTNAFTKLAPFKVQVANIDPEVLLFIDILSQKEILIIENLFKKSETSAATIINSGTVYVDNSYRVADLFWYQNNQHHVFKALTQRLEVIFFTY